MNTEPPLLLFYPTSAVHVRDWQQVFHKLPGWRILALVYAPQEYFAPGILAALRTQGTPTLVIEQGYDFDLLLPDDVSVVVLGAVFEAFGMDLIGWARLHGSPVAAIEEVAQLGLNLNEINNYDAPFDRLFVASADEHQRFIALGYPPEMLTTSGLLSYDRLQLEQRSDNMELRQSLGIGDRPKPIVYTTSPLCSRISIHTKDNPAFRDAVLKQVMIASSRTGRPVVIKLHPSEDRVEVRDLLRHDFPDAIVIGRELPMDELFAITGVLLNRGNSQTCLEAILRGVPTVVAACGIRSLFHEAGGTLVVDTFDAIPAAISRALNEVPSGVDELKARYFFSPPEGVASLIARELEILAGGSPVADDHGWDWLLRTELFAGELKLALRLARQLGPGTRWRESAFAALEAHLSGQREEAIARWQDCIEGDPTWYWPHFELAHAHVAAGQYPLALVHAQRAIQLLPSHYRVWHEIPMRRMIMVAYRAMGEHSKAALELAALEDRSLVDVLPELLLEKAEQRIATGDAYGSAIHCADQALAGIAKVPVNDGLDGDLRNKARTLLLGQGERCESKAMYPVAVDCYSCVSRWMPEDAWSRFALARVGLAQYRLLDAFGLLFDISGIPGAARKITEHALTDSRVAELAPLWPTSNGGILKSIKLAGFSWAWFADALRGDRHGLANHAALCILLTMFCLKHFVRQLIGPSVPRA